MLLQPGGRPVPNCPEYVLIRKLGAGAFGEVWHALGPGGLDVALKFIPNVPASELRSLGATKSIRHPNLVSLFGAWHKDGSLILAMEKCDRSLHDRLNEALGQNLPGIPLKELLTYMTDAANGLDALNTQQVQHRDVKPANLLLLNGGLKVADFGLAKALEETIASNSGAGTLAYTAPECFQGQLTRQSDQYSLAVTYYHLRTGRLLFKGDPAQIMYAHLEREPDLSQLPPLEAAVIARALSKEPGKRWPSCTAFVHEVVATHQELARQQAEQRQREEARQRVEALQRQAAVIRRKEQEVQKINVEAHQGRREETVRAPAAEPGVKENADSKTCCWCHKREADGSPEEVDLYFDERGLLDIPVGLAGYRTTKVLIPQCSECKKLEFTVGTGIALIGCLGSFLLLCVSVSLRLSDWLGLGSLIVLLPSLGYMMVVGLAIQRKHASFPPVKTLLDAGWKFGKGP